jgi:hypothetical protein
MWTNPPGFSLSEGFLFAKVAAGGATGIVSMPDYARWRRSREYGGEGGRDREGSAVPWAVRLCGEGKWQVK